MRNSGLYQRLQSFRFEAGEAALPFADRLARDHRWTPAFAGRVVTEYLRFVYLAAVADAPVTPSVAVDQAWHLHLCYTRSYWEDLCRDILPRPLHHGPTRGGRKEAAKFNDWYERTLALYAAEFGEEPPRDIWPPAAERFAPKAQPVSVPARDFWVVEKRLVLRIAAAFAATGTAVPVWIGAKDGGGIIVAIGALSVAVLIVWRLFRSSVKSRRHRRPRIGRDAGGCGSAGCGSSHHTDSGCGGGGGGGCGGGD